MIATNKIDERSFQQKMADRTKAPSAIIAPVVILLVYKFITNLTGTVWMIQIHSGLDTYFNQQIPACAQEEIWIHIAC